MSHVATLDCKITNLEALRKAVEKRGLAMRKDTNYRWYNQWVGDYHASDAAYKHYDPKLFGKNAEYVIYDPKNPSAYEVGVVPHYEKDGSYTLMLDFWGSQGKHIANKVGGNGSQGLIQDYQLEAIREEAGPLIQQGFVETIYKDKTTQELVPIYSNEGIPQEIQDEVNAGQLYLYEQE